MAMLFFGYPMLTHTASPYRLHLSQIIWIFVNSQKALGDTSETFQALMFHFLGAGRNREAISLTPTDQIRSQISFLLVRMG